MSSSFYSSRKMSINPNTDRQSHFQSSQQGQFEAVLFKQFQSLKKINVILDSNPESSAGKDQKIRSLIIMYKQQLEVNKSLEQKVLQLQKILEGRQSELLKKTTQCANYQKQLLDCKQKSIQLESKLRKQNFVLTERQQQLKLREELIQNMKLTNAKNKASMQAELDFFKKNTLQQFDKNVQLSSQYQSALQQRVVCSELGNYKSCSKRNIAEKSLKNCKPGSCSKSKKNIIQRNINAISKTSNKENSAGKALEQFQRDKIYAQRRHQIQNGNYRLPFDNNFQFQL